MNVSMNPFLGKIPYVPLDAKAILEVARTQRPDLYAAVMRVASDFCCGAMEYMHRQKSTATEGTNPRTFLANLSQKKLAE